MKIRVLVVDDQITVRQGLTMFLQLDDEIMIVGTAENGQQAIAQAAESQPTLVLIDLLMPVMDGVSAIRRLRQQYPQLHIIALTSSQDDDLLNTALAAGADYYIQKTISPQTLVRVIKAIGAGRVLLPVNRPYDLLPDIDRQVTSQMMTEADTNLIQLLAQSLPTQQILQQLNLTETDYHSALDRLKQVFHVSSTLLVVISAIAFKLIEVPATTSL